MQPHNVPDRPASTYLSTDKDADFDAAAGVDEDPEVNPFAPTADAPAGTLASLKLDWPVVLGTKTRTEYTVLHFPELTGEALQHIRFGVHFTIGDLLLVGSLLGGYPLVVFKKMRAPDVTRFTKLITGPQFLGEQGPDTGAPT